MLWVFQHLTKKQLLSVSEYGSSNCLRDTEGHLLRHQQTEEAAEDNHNNTWYISKQFSGSMGERSNLHQAHLGVLGQDIKSPYKNQHVLFISIMIILLITLGQFLWTRWGTRGNGFIFLYRDCGEK